MANYNVGNIEVGVISNSRSALSQLTNVEKKIKDIQIAQNSQSQNAIKNAKVTESAFKRFANAYNDIKSGLGEIINLNYLYVAFNYLRRVASSVANIITKASDYAEALNKFQVSFGNLAETNLDYVNQLSKAYGLSRLTLMEYTSTFNNMLKALGNLEEGISAKFSRTLTQMAIDYASLFNQSIDSTMKAFQSVLAGSVRPIRSASGFDVSETTIFSIYQELGGTKTMRQLNQLEKRLLRIYAIQTQLKETGAVGDYEKTIEFFSNQVRILQEQITEFGSTWGKLILYYITPAIRWINGLLFAVNEVGDAITKELIDNGTDLSKVFASMGKETNGLTDSVNELNNSLTQLGLDELNIIGGGSASGVGDVEDIIKNAVLTYSTNLTEINMKAKEISKSILEWAGYTYDADGNLVNARDRTKEIATDFAGILGIFVGGGLISKILKIAPSLAPIGKALMTAFSGPIGWIIAGVGILGVAISDVIKNNKEKTNEWLDGLTVAWESSIKPALDSLLTIFGQIKIVLENAWKNIIVPIAEIVGDLLVYTVVPLLGTVLNIISKIFGFIMPFITVASSIITPLLDMIISGLGSALKVAELIVRFILRAVDGIVNILGLFIDPLIDVINWLIEQINKLGENVPEWLGGGWELKKIEKMSFDDITAKLDTSSITNDTTASDSMASTTDNNVAMTNAILESNNRVVQAINNKNTVLEVNGKNLAETIYDDMNDVYSRKGLI